MFSRQGEKNTLQTKIRDICSVSMYKMLARYRLEPSRPEKHCHCIVKCVYEDVAYLRRGPMSVGLFHTYLQLHTYSHPLSLPQALSLTNAYLIIRVWYRRRRLAGSLFAYSNVIFVQILLLAVKLKYLFLSLSLLLYFLKSFSHQVETSTFFYFCKTFLHAFCIDRSLPLYRLFVVVGMSVSLVVRPIFLKTFFASSGDRTCTTNAFEAYLLVSFRLLCYWYCHTTGHSTTQHEQGKEVVYCYYVTLSSVLVALPFFYFIWEG